MNSFTKRNNALNSKVSRIGATLGAVSMGAMLMALPSIAAAQDTGATSGEVVVVTGIRASLAKSVNQKKAASVIGEAITAEEIGKLPDASIAESLARLPGVAGQRVNGEVQVINLRGTSPDFTVTTFNGRLQGSLGDGRGVEVDQYPAELMNGVFVYKTPDSAIAGQGLSGTVDLRSIRPLSQKGPAKVINFRLDSSNMDKLNPEANKLGGRASFSYVDQFMDGKLGVAFGLAISQVTRQTQHQKIWNWRAASTGNGNALVGAPDAVRNAYMPTGFEWRAISTNKDRVGAMGVIEYKASDTSHTTLDLYYSQYKQDEYLRGIEGYSEWGVDGLTIPAAGAVAVDLGGSKYLDTYTFQNWRPIINNQLHARDDSVLSIGLNQEFKAGMWDMVADLSYSKAEGDATNIQIISGYGANSTLDNMNVNIDPDGFSQFDPTLNYGDASKIYLGDNAAWGGWGQEGFRTLPHVEDEYIGLDFRAKTSLKDSFVGNVFDNLEVGFNLTSHNKLKSSTDEDLCLKTAVASTGLGQDGGNNCVPGAGTSTRRRAANPITSIGSTDLSWAGWGPVAVFDLLGTMNSQYNIIGRRDSNRYNRDWSLGEEVATLYAKLNIDSELFGKPLRGNLGVQFVDSRTTSTGYAITGASNNPGNAGYNNTPVLRTVDNHYTDVLPALNLSYDFISNFKVRLGIAKQMARPRPDQLRASVNASLSLASNVPGNENFGKYRWGGSAGNPDLEPWRATSYDLSAEWYIPGGIIAVAGFYKDVETYIYAQNFLFDFSSIPNPTNLPTVSNYGNMSLMQNGQGGYIKGIEVQATIDAGKFVPVLDGFGFNGSYTHNYTNISPDGPGTTNTLPGFSGETRNLTAYYEKYGISVRVSQRWRSSFRSDVAGLFADRAFSEILADEQTDAQIGYEFKEGSLKGMSVLFQALNLTDSPYRTRTGVKTGDGSFLPELYVKYGTQYLFGVRYKF